ncbi:hypothetical protein LPJ73_002611 [Coemansia sp. RSA 2703]|nr:hypothetical protein LPJ73_002611 [Coemansia sp. RSA 2703]
MTSSPTTSMYTAYDTPFTRSPTPSPNIRYMQAKEDVSSSQRSRIVMPRQRSAGIGGYSCTYSESGIGGHVPARDMGIGKACLGDSPRIPRAGRAQSPVVRGLASVKRVLSFSSLSGAK